MEDSHMIVSKAEYRVKAEFADRNLANIRAYLPEVHRRLRPGSTYSVSVSSDGRSFLHLFIHETKQEAAMLGEIPAFLTFLDEVMQQGCEAPPVMMDFVEL
jgi:hypothetical protein